MVISSSSVIFGLDAVARIEAEPSTRKYPVTDLHPDFLIRVWRGSATKGGLR